MANQPVRHWFIAIHWLVHWFAIGLPLLAGRTWHRYQTIQWFTICREPVSNDLVDSYNVDSAGTGYSCWSELN